MGGTWQPPRHASKNMAASAQHVMLYKRADLMLAGSQIHMYISFQCLRRDAGAMSSQWQTSLRSVIVARTKLNAAISKVALSLAQNYCLSSLQL
eukprot:scaffold222532_cov17-Tisochrysis_lutea.AAC.1